MMFKNIKPVQPHKRHKFVAYMSPSSGGVVAQAGEASPFLCPVDKILIVTMGFLEKIYIYSFLPLYFI